MVEAEGEGPPGPAPPPPRLFPPDWPYWPIKEPSSVKTPPEIKYNVMFIIHYCFSLQI